MEILGHSSISLTMNTYSHVMPAMQEEVAAKMNDILTPARTASGGPAPADEMMTRNGVATSMATRPHSEAIN